MHCKYYYYSRKKMCIANTLRKSKIPDHYGQAHHFSDAYIMRIYLRYTFYELVHYYHIGIGYGYIK